MDAVDPWHSLGIPCKSYGAGLILESLLQGWEEILLVCLGPRRPCEIPCKSFGCKTVILVIQYFLGDEEDERKISSVSY